MYEHLAESRDPALADRALALALSDEPPKTLMAALISDVAWRHPKRAFDFTVARWDRIQRRLQAGSTVWYVPGLVGQAPDAELVVKLERFAKRHIPANAQGDMLKAKANMLYRSRIREEQLPQIDRWLQGDTTIHARK